MLSILLEYTTFTDQSTSATVLKSGNSEDIEKYFQYVGEVEQHRRTVDDSFESEFAILDLNTKELNLSEEEQTAITKWLFNHTLNPITKKIAETLLSSYFIDESQKINVIKSMLNDILEDATV